MENLNLHNFQPLKVAILTPMSLRHRYFIKTLLENQIKIEFIIRIKKKRKLKEKFRDFLTISSFLNLLNTFFEFLRLGWISNPKVQVFKVCKYSDIFESELMQIKQIDVFIVYGGPIISKKILVSQKSIFLNVHGAVLPGYRGLDSHWWLYLDRKYHLQGYTIHFVSEKLDAGRILKTNEFKSSLIGPNRLLLWRVWVAKNSALDLVRILYNPLSLQNTSSHDLRTSLYRSSLSVANMLKHNNKLNNFRINYNNDY